MPIIKPPLDLPAPKTLITEDSSEVSQSEHERIRKYLDCKNWKCPSCGSVVFGRCMKCPYCFGRKGIYTPRPEGFEP